MSTFVNDLRLEEIGSGERSGTWGTATNTNLSLIAEAFSYGTETMGDANTTITMSDAVSDEVRSLYLKITSSADLTTTRVVTLAPNSVSKVWIIENATSGSQIITIKQGSGATVNIPNGSVKVIATDGGGTSGAVFDLFTDLDVAGTFAVAGNTTVGGTLTSTGAVTANAGVSIDNITIDGTEIDLSSGDLTLDVAGDIVLNSDDGIIFLKDDTATFGSLNNSSGNLIIKSGTTTAATFSGANVTLAGTVVTGGLTTLGGNLIIPNAGNIGSVGDTDAIAISSGGVVTMNQIPVFSAGINVSGGTITGTLATAAQTNITSVGALGGGSISSGFGAINNGSSNITTTGTISFGSLTDGTTTITSVDQDISSVSSSHDTLATALAIKTYVDNQTVTATGIVGTGTGNTAIGTNAMDSVLSTGNRNTAFGFNAGTGITSANRNVHIGFEAGKLVTEGNSNVYIGAFAGDAATGSSEGNNTCVGDSAGGAITDGSENTLIGQGAGASITTASGQTAIGRESLLSNQTNVRNTAVGHGASIYLKGDDNTSLGYSALAGNSSSAATGINNVAIGTEAMGGNNHTSASDNVAIGFKAFTAATSGQDNTFIGKNVALEVTTGSYNVAVGEQAMAHATSPTYSTACGDFALANNFNEGGLDTKLTGTYNSAFGFQALGAQITSGGYNSACGAWAGREVTTGSNNFFVGYEAGRTGSPGGSVTTGSNEGYLGDENITTINAQVGITAASDKRDKTDVNNLNLGLEFVNKLTPVTFRWDKRIKYANKSTDFTKADDIDLNKITPDGTHKENKLDVGFLAQDVIEIEESYNYKMSEETNLVSKLSGDGKQYSLQYERFVPMLVKALQELSDKNDALEARIKTLEG